MIPAEILKAWAIEQTTIRPVGHGLIHHSYRCGGNGAGLLLQRLNRHVFARPQDITENILLVLERLRSIDQNDLIIPELIPSVSGNWTELDQNQNTWRAYAFIPQTKTYDGPVAPDIGFHAAFAFGRFGNWLRSVPVCDVIEVLPDFHNTPVRLAAFRKAVRQDVVGRTAGIRKELQYLEDQAVHSKKLTDLLLAEPSAKTVCHNDAKVPNLLMDAVSNRPKAVVDLDTLMPGTVLFDLGDLVRTACSTVPEDSPALDELCFRDDVYREIKSGFEEGLGNSLLVQERELMDWAGPVITFEQALRFAADYLQGDRYYPTKSPDENLIRARNQIELHRQMVTKLGL